MLQALLFDMNGVIVDDMPFHERAWMALAARHGRTLTPDEFRREMSGRRNRDNIRHIFGEALSDWQVHAYQLEKEEAYREAYRPLRAPLPGLVPFLVEARAAGLRIAVATSAPKDNIDFVLDGLDLRRQFDVVVGEAEVTRSKPDPGDLPDSGVAVGRGFLRMHRVRRLTCGHRVRARGRHAGGRGDDHAHGGRASRLRTRHRRFRDLTIAHISRLASLGQTASGLDFRRPRAQSRLL